MPLIKHTSTGQSGPSLPPPTVGQEAAENHLPASAPPTVAEKAKSVYTGRKATPDDDKMSKADWAAKDRRIGRAGLYQAALQSVGVLQYSPDVRSLADYLKAVRAAAEDGLKFVSESEEK